MGGGLSGGRRFNMEPPRGSRIGNLPKLRVPHANSVRSHQVPARIRSRPWSRSQQAGDFQFRRVQINDKLRSRQVVMCHQDSGADFRFGFPTERGMSRSFGWSCSGRRFDRCYGRSDKSMSPSAFWSWAVADETGLGKTHVAKEIITLAVEHLQQTDQLDRIDIVYVCSNADIAAQNIRSSTSPGQRAQVLQLG